MGTPAPGPDVLKELEEAALALEDQTPEDVLRWAFERYQPDITLACSFGGTSGMALVDMASRIETDVDVFFLDTGFLFPETYELVSEIGRRYGIHATAYKPTLTPEQQAAELGEALWLRSPDLCCSLRKIEPNYRALAGKRAWIAGLRRDQSSSRRLVRPVEWDWKFGLVKFNPLATWTEAQVWDYIQEHDVPYNPLHDQGYPSLGCTQCTRPAEPGEDARAGRWPGFAKTECGLHETSGRRWK